MAYYVGEELRRTYPKLAALHTEDVTTSQVGASDGDDETTSDE